MSSEGSLPRPLNRVTPPGARPAERGVMFVFYIYAGVLLGILIIVHEVGHFIAARAAGVTVERFSIGFGPRIAKFTRGETEYAISLIPLGGYVKMAGMDPSEGEGDAAPGPRTFLGKRIGVRALIVSAGPVTNFVWAFIVYTGVLWASGLPTLGEPLVGEVAPGSVADSAGLRLGDRIVSVDGVEVANWAEVVEQAGEGEADRYDLVVRRHDGTEVPVVLEAVPDSAGGAPRLDLTAFVPPVVGDVLRGGPADLAGIRSGDRVLSVDGISVETWNGLGDIIRMRADTEVEIVWQRDGETMRAVVTPVESEEPVGTTGVQRVGQIGVMRTWDVRDLGLGESIVTGFRITVSNVVLIAQFFWGLVRGQIATEMLGGPIRVVQLASESARWGASYFFSFMAFLSLNLFLINLFPLPILDGGHLVLLGLEKVRGRRLTDRQLMVWQQIGLIFFVGLMIVMIVVDTLRAR